MQFPALNTYLARLSDPARPGSSLSLNAQDQVEGQFFNCTLTSAFQPIWLVGDDWPAAYEAGARNVAAEDAGLSLWRLLDNAASDDESIELDRLCRMLHAINFFRQPAALDADLFLNVHSRLLSAVSSNHDALGLPLERIVLQLPSVNATQRWLLGYVTDNYKRNGFRMALKLAAHGLAGEVIAQVRPAAIKVDVQSLGDDAALETLLAATQARNAQLIVTGVAAATQLARLEHVAKALALPLYAQGGDWGPTLTCEQVQHPYPGDVLRPTTGEPATT